MLRSSILRSVVALCAILFIYATASAQPPRSGPPRGGPPRSDHERDVRMARGLERDYADVRAQYDSITRRVKEFDREALRQIRAELEESRKDLERFRGRGPGARREYDREQQKIARLGQLQSRYMREEGRMTPESLNAKQSILKELVELVRY